MLTSLHPQDLTDRVGRAVAAIVKTNKGHGYARIEEEIYDNEDVELNALGSPLNIGPSRIEVTSS